MSQASPPVERIEAIGSDLLQVRRAWPLLSNLAERHRFSRTRLPLLDHSLRIDKFAFFEAHDFQPDHLSASVMARATFEQTYARPIRPKTDNELPGDTLEAIEHNHMPQFTLRNIGRYEMSVDEEAGLPWRKTRGLGGKLGSELEEVRKAHVPKPRMAQIWSLQLMKKVRFSFRRILVEDPWELRLGHEVTSAHTGQRYTFIAEGTHEDDLAGVAWGPDVVPVPSVWQGPPPGEEPMPKPRSMADEIQRDFAT